MNIETTKPVCEVRSGKDARVEVDAFYESVGSVHRARDEDTFFLLKEGDRVIGTVRYCVEEGVSLLRSMNVHPDYRGKKFGGILLDAFEGFVEKNGDQIVFGIPYAHLMSFYGQIGFHEINESEAPLFLQERIKQYRDQYKDKSYSMMRRLRR